MASDGSLTATNYILSGNIGDGMGGAIVAHSDASLNATNCTFSTNEASFPADLRWC